MLLNPKSAERNVIGNLGTNTLNAISDLFSVAADTVIAGKTGTRTRALVGPRAHLQAAKAFGRATVDTFKDVFIDKAITHHGNDKYNTNVRGRTFQNAPQEFFANVENFLMSVGDRNFWARAYELSLAEQRKLAGLNARTEKGVDTDKSVNPDDKSLWVEKTPQSMIDRAERDANYATFTEDNKVKDALTNLKRADPTGILDILLPFTGVPTNIIKRMYEYSPVNLAITALHSGYNAINNELADHEVGRFQRRDFTPEEQLKFVNNIGRGLTGTAMFMVGGALLRSGFLKLGTGSDDDPKVAALNRAKGDMYSPYVQFGDINYDFSALAPGIIPLLMGAKFAQTIGDTNVLDSAWQALLVSVDTIFD